MSETSMISGAELTNGQAQAGDTTQTGAETTTKGQAEGDSAATGGGDPGGADQQNLDPFKDVDQFRDEKGLICGKYKEIPDLIDGYKEATKKLREKFPEPPASPDAYELKFEDASLKDVTIEADDPLWKEMAPVLHEGKVTNAVASKMVETYLKFNMEQEAKRLEGEQKKLGDQLDVIKGDMKKYLDKTIDPKAPEKGPDAGMVALFELAGASADALQAVHRLLKSQGEKPIPTNLGGGNQYAGKTSGELKDEAFAYRNQHEAGGKSMSREQIQKYDAMLEAAAKLELAGK